VIYTLYKRLSAIAKNEFADIVLDSEIIFSYSGRARKLRIVLIDGTFIDVWYSLDGGYSLHWEQRGVRDAVYRHDNAPHRRWSKIKTFPQHCHDTTEDNVCESYIPKDPEQAIQEYMDIVRKRLFKLKSHPGAKRDSSE
jgi:hypothetical protein